MIKEIWLNLPVKDLQRSKTFFTSLGFEPTRDAPEMVGFLVGEKKTPVMMVHEEHFKKYSGHEISDTGRGSELLISFDAENKAEVDNMADKVEQAGGSIYSGPSDIQGWMYGFAFVDIDGHRWNMVYMDWAKMPKE